MKIETIEQLRSLYSAPGQRARLKNIGRIDEHIGKFISLSPLVVVSSGNDQSQLDASPRGGKPGFVKMVDSHTLLIPDAIGNNRLDTLENILSTSQVGLLFFIPGVDEMVRVNGRAHLSNDGDALKYFSKLERQPKLVIHVEVEDAYLHCAKALMRSKLWHLESQIDRSSLPTMGEILKVHTNHDGHMESQEEMLQRYSSQI